MLSSAFCGGVLIAPHVVATVAHCLAGRRPPGVDVIVGADNVCPGAPVTGQRIPARAFTMAGSLPTAPGTDIVKITLDRAATVSPATSTPVPHAAKAVVGVAVGWGQVRANGPYPCHAKSIALTGADPTRCQSMLARAPAGAPVRNLWCAQPPGDDPNTCVGDSGGPVYLAAATPGTERVFALTTWGVGCGPRDVGFYSVLGNLDRTPGPSPGFASGRDGDRPR